MAREDAALRRRVALARPVRLGADLLATMSVVGLALVDISGPEGTVTRLARELGSLSGRG